MCRYGNEEGVRVRVRGEGGEENREGEGLRRAREGACKAVGKGAR